MKILITYATYSGSTRFVAEYIQEKLTKLGHTVVMKDIKETKPEDFEPHEAFILGTNSWYENKEEGMMHGAYLDFKEKVKDNILFHKRPVAVFALGDASQYLQFCKSADHLEAMVKDFDGTLVVPALRIDQYYAEPQKKEEQVDVWLLEVLKAFTS